LLTLSKRESMSELIEKLNKTYFWDVNLNNLDENKSKRLIVERTLNFGTLNEIKLVINYYGLQEIKKIACNLAYIDPKTLNFLSILFDIPKTEFKCYTRKQLKDQSWNY